MSELPDFSTWKVTSPETAMTLIKSQMGGLRGRNRKVFVVVPDASGVMAHEQRKQYALLMVDYGFVMGLIEMAHAAGFLADAGYYELKQDAHRLTMPGVVGVVGSVFGG